MEKTLARRWFVGLGLGAIWMGAAMAGQTSLGAGDSDSFQLGSDGNVYSWGANSSGQLGDGSTTNRSQAVKVALPSGVTKFTVLGAGRSHTLALGDDGVLYGWGLNDHGQLGDGSTTNRSVPTAITLPGGVVVKAVAGGQSHSMAVSTDGRLFAWGDNTHGQLGDGTTVERHSPVQVPFPSGVTAFSFVRAGLNHTVAAGNDGKAYAWGRNNSGQLCDGTTTDRSSPAAIPGTGSGPTIVIDGAAGNSHSLALGAGGHIYACGSNAFGQLGDNTFVNRLTPVSVMFPPGVHGFVTLKTRADHNIAEGDNGQSYTWGLNDHGQLGDGTTTNRALPGAIQFPSGLTSFTSARVGSQHTVAFGSDSRVYAWGANGSGQLGDGSTTERLTAVRVTGLPTYAQLATALYTSIPLGTLWNTSMRTRSWMLLKHDLGANWPMTTDLATGGLDLVADFWAHDGVNTYSSANAYINEVGPSPNVAMSTDANGNPSGILFQLVSPLPPHSIGTPIAFINVDSRNSLSTQVEANLGTCTALLSTTCTAMSQTDGAFGPLSGAGGFANFINGQPSPRATMTTPGIYVSEGAANAKVIVQRPGTSWGSLSIDYATADRSALAGSDYTTTTGTLTWADGDKTAKTITVPILHDAVTESTKSFLVTLSNPVNNLMTAYIGTLATTRVFVVDDDPAVPFSDVSPNSFALSHINSLLGAGITTGCGGGKYCPTQNVTREQMAAFIVRSVEGNPAAGYCGATAPFGDVPVSNTFCGHIKRMLELNITTGCGGGNYCPTQNVTREQMAAFIVRAVEGNPVAGYCGTTAPFGDVQVSNGFCGHIKRMLELNITTGCGGGNYCPTQNVTREQMAAFLGRAFLGM